MSDAGTAPLPTHALGAAQVDALLDRAWDERLSDAGAALALCNEAHEMAQVLSYRRGVARGLYVKCWVTMRLSKPRDAVEHALAALPLFEALGDDKGTENTLNALGIIYSALGELGEAHQHFLSRYHLCIGRGDEDEAEALLNLGYIHDYLGNHADALEHYLKSWEIFATCGSPFDQARLLNNIGYSYYRLEEHEAALEHYRKGLALSESDANLYALLLDNMALAFEKRGDVENALSHQQQSLNLREAQGDKRGVSYSLDSLGSIYQALGEASRAQDCLERSLALKEALCDQKGEAETLLLLGGLLLNRNQAAKALPLLQRSLLTAVRIGHQEGVYGAHKALSGAFKSEGRLAEALEHHELYCEVKERVVSEASRRALGSLRVQFETEQAEREREIYRLKNVELVHANEALRRLNEQAAGLLERLERQAKEDALTGLYNRRHADARLREEFVRARRFGHPLSVALLDIDNFKSVNDTFSHATGDEVLRTVARLFKEHLRGVDTAARFGGEEFLLLFPETAAPGAFTACDELRQRVAAYPWEAVAPGLRVTLSIGLSDDTSVSDHEKLVALADAKLYEAKRSGKNQVRV